MEDVFLGKYVLVFGEWLTEFVPPLKHEIRMVAFLLLLVSLYLGFMLERSGLTGENSYWILTLINWTGIFTAFGLFILSHVVKPLDEGQEEAATEAS